MKKFFALALTAAMIMSLAACSETTTEETTTEATTTVAETEATTTVAETEATEATEATEETTEATEADAPAVEPMTYDEYVAAEVDDEVVVCAYVQAKQSWWDNKATVYLQNEEGAFFCYEMACSEEDYELLVPGQAILVTGYKGEWAGEVEIVDATFEIVDGNWIAEAKDVTEFLGTDELVNYQNQFVSFTDMTVVSVAFKNEEPGDDIYVTLSKDNAEYSFCLEYYLNGSDEEFYALVSGLEADQTVDVEGYLYWYEGVNTHITAVTVK